MASGGLLQFASIKKEVSKREKELLNKRHFTLSMKSEDWVLLLDACGSSFSLQKVAHANVKEVSGLYSILIHLPPLRYVPCENCISSVS